ncbi:MAG: membrane protein insertion efficiency factor YidD, partial [Pseudolabrys sp.]
MPSKRLQLFSPLARLPRLAGRGLVGLYRVTLSPLIGPRCRHLPTCSDYAD